VLVVREIDPLARNLAKQLVVEQELKAAGVEIDYILDRFDDTPEGILQKNVKAIFAEYERTKIAWRNARGRRSKARSGQVVGCGRTAYGYLSSIITS
jgi:DNA invertase Pin-like site-specific DNA recombinase